MFNVDAAGKRARNAVTAAMIATTLASLAGCGGGTTSVPYAGPPVSTPSAGGGSSGGGGATGSASPFILFASSYIAYSAQTNGAFLHSVQGGDVFTGQGGNWSFNQANGAYSSDQLAMNSTGLYIFQEKAAAGAPNTSNDYLYVAVSAPANATTDISQANTLLIQMGNSVATAATAGNANKFTVDINNGKGGVAATGDCAYDQTLAEVGANVAGPPGSALGVRTYAIPLSAFTCSVGTLATLKSSGITTVAVSILGARNSTLPSGEIDNINIGMIGFTDTVASGSLSALAQ